MQKQILILVLLISLRSMGAQWTLEEALAYSRTNSPDIRIAQQRLRAAEAAVQQANALFWPALRLQSSYTSTDNPMNVFGAILNQRAYHSNLDFNDVPDADNLNLRGIITAPLYAGGRNSAARSAAKANRRAMQAEAEAVQKQLEYQVLESFHTLAKSHRYIEAAEAAVRSLQTNRAVAQTRVDSGTLLKAELLQIEVQLGHSREDLIRARNSVALAGSGLKNLLGLDDADFTIPLSTPPMEAPTTRDFSGRPELRVVSHRIQAAEAELSRARGGYLPRVSGFGELDYDRGWKFSGSGSSYAAGVIAEWDLWDGNATRGKVQQAKANLQAIEEEGRKIRSSIRLELEQAELRLREAEERLIVTEKSVQQAEESLRLTEGRFAQGLVLSNELLAIQSALTSARVRRAEADADREIAIGALKKALGFSQGSNGGQIK